MKINDDIWSNGYLNILDCLTYTNRTEDANLITHSGRHHADDVMGTVIIANFFYGKPLKLIRIPSLEKNHKYKGIPFDIGHGIYDHHQRGGNGKRKYGAQYSSAGLLWRDFGRGALENYPALINANNAGFKVDIEHLWDVIDKELIQPIDRADTGGYTIGFKENYNITKMVSCFRAKVQSKAASDAAYLEAVDYLNKIFAKYVESVLEKQIALHEFKSLVYPDNEVNIDEFNRYQNLGEILILDKELPFQDLFDEDDKFDDIKFVITPSQRNGYNILLVYQGKGVRIPRVMFPRNWCGLLKNELVLTTGIETAEFCHYKGFKAGAKTLDGAIAIAKLAIEMSKKTY